MLNIFATGIYTQLIGQFWRSGSTGNREETHNFLPCFSTAQSAPAFMHAYLLLSEEYIWESEKVSSSNHRFQRKRQEECLVVICVALNCWTACTFSVRFYSIRRRAGLACNILVLVPLRRLPIAGDATWSAAETKLIMGPSQFTLIHCNLTPTMRLHTAPSQSNHTPTLPPYTFAFQLRKCDFF